MKIAIELLLGVSVFLNIVFGSIALFPSLLRHPKAFVRFLARLAIATVYQMNIRICLNTWWFSLWTFSWFVIWGAVSAVAFAHGWYFVSVCIFLGLVYAVYSQALMTFRQLNYVL